jgi:hypothetical protein
VAIRFDYLRGGRQVSLRNQNEMWIWRNLAAWAGLAIALPACAQYPVQTAKSGSDAGQMRAISVLEWTGEEGHPKASRIVPVTVYDGQNLQDGGIYLARPAPLALMSEVEYELKQNGKTVGLYVINGAGQEQGSWVGFGVWKPLPKPKPAMQSAKIEKVDDWGGDTQSDRPVLHRKTKSGDSSSEDSGSTAPEADPDRPTLHKKSASESGGGAGTASSEPAPDPDRPTLQKKTEGSDSSSTASTAADDPDRPRLKKKAETPAPQPASYTESTRTATDPDRPRLLRGKPADDGAKVLPTLMGFPADMQQAVAVSDARNRPEHIWSYSWANPDDEAKMKAGLEEIARKALGLTPTPAPSTPAPKLTAAARRKAKAAPEAPAAPASLLDEQLRVFELSYGSGATMVFSARTNGVGAEQKFVTLVAQPDLYGNALVLLKNVTDAAHLDDTPRMRLVDAVDVLADNRGELLFELRGATQRQFALYRVLRGQVDKLFVSGPGGIVPPPSNAAVAGAHS